MKDLLLHFFTPRESNNHRAKALHFQSLLFFILALFIGQLFLFPIKTNYPSILGTSIDVASEQLLSLTNRERQEQGVTPVKLNEELSQAAMKKAKYMFEKNFWSHTAPDGKTPWYFFKQAGYDYAYAGENLARGFTKSDDVVNAWMASPTHRENMLSSNYQEVGFAVMKGNLLGEETTVVVEMFGSRSYDTLAKNPIVHETSSLAATAQENSQVFASVKMQPLIDSAFFTKNIGIGILALFIFVLIADMIIIERKKIARVVGHNIDHILYFGAIFIIILVISTGVIL